MAVLAHRENFNALSFDVLTLFINYTDDQKKPNWQIIPVFDKEEHLEVTVGGGADCLLHDFRLVRINPKKPLQLIIADREFGETFADAMPVIFSYYDLKFNEDGDMGRPYYYYEFVKKTTSLKKYCDVGAAFLEELGLENYRTKEP